MPIAFSVRITRTAISPRLATRTVSNPTTSHPEDAVGNRLDGCIRHNRKRKTDNRSGVGGIDHAVVPKPGRRIVRVALVLVLCTDRGLERFFLVGRHLHAYRRQYRRRLLTTHDRDSGVGPHP